ncbi:MAG TPA: hypothetical protein PLT35_13790, partial [Vicinamibacterales bacterium]|nr:hypothetical protein [Vicinamibacterales bacterium]
GAFNADGGRVLLQRRRRRHSVARRSFTPTFKTYQVRAGDGEGRGCGDTLSLALERRLNRFAFRAVSLFGVTGPARRVAGAEAASHGQWPSHRP